MGGEKAETTMPKTVAARSETAQGNLRWQVYQKDDCVHVHDDTKGLVFVWKGVRKFQIAADSFLRIDRHSHKDDICAFRGETSDPGSSRKPGDLVYKLGKDGWEVGVDPVGEYADFEIKGDAVLDALHSFIHEKC